MTQDKEYQKTGIMKYKALTPAQERKVTAQQKKENAKIQRAIHIEVEKQKSRYAALETAKYLKPTTPIANALNQSLPVLPKYNIVEESEKIYQWLIKDLK